MFPTRSVRLNSCCTTTGPTSRSSAGCRVWRLRRKSPCFALTSLHAGSDATGLIDSGVVCRGEFDGEEVIGIRLNWDKRYITLAPVSTVLGLAFKLYDPDHLIGERDEYGITAALIPTNLPGVEIGRRHLPIGIPFQNGPTRGVDVFAPLDCIVGGPEMAGEGWRMLVELLSAGRGIALPQQRRRRRHGRRIRHRCLCAHSQAVQAAHRRVSRRRRSVGAHDRLLPTS